MRIRLLKRKIAEILDKSYQDEIYGATEASDFIRDVLKEHGYEVEIRNEEDFEGEH